MGAVAVGETAFAKRKLMASVLPSRHIFSREICSSESASSSSSTAPSDSKSSVSESSGGDGSLVEGGAGTFLAALDFCSTFGICLGALESSPTTFFHSLVDILST